MACTSRPPFYYFLKEINDLKHSLWTYHNLFHCSVNKFNKVQVYISGVGGFNWGILYLFGSITESNQYMETEKDRTLLEERNIEPTQLIMLKGHYNVFILAVLYLDSLAKALEISKTYLLHNRSILLSHMHIYTHTHTQ